MERDLNPVVTRAAESLDSRTGSKALLPPFANSFFCNFRQVKKKWRKRVGVEPTSRAAKERDNGFEDREDHRAPFASASSIAWISTLDRRVPREPDRVGASC